MRNVTIKVLAAELGIDYIQAAGLVKIMVGQGVASEAGKQPTLTGKGKPATIYAIPESFTISLGEVAKAA